MEETTENRKLFIVEFGKPSMSSWSFGGSDPLFVLAKSYNEAAKKALLYMENKSTDKSNVLDSDGSLNKNILEPLSIKAVKLACEEIVW